MTPPHTHDDQVNTSSGQHMIPNAYRSDLTLTQNQVLQNIVTRWIAEQGPPGPNLSTTPVLAVLDFISSLATADELSALEQEQYLQQDFPVLVDNESGPQQISQSQASPSQDDDNTFLAHDADLDDLSAGLDDDFAWLISNVADIPDEDVHHDNCAQVTVFYPIADDTIASHHWPVMLDIVQVANQYKPFGSASLNLPDMTMQQCQQAIAKYATPQQQAFLFQDACAPQKDRVRNTNTRLGLSIDTDSSGSDKNNTPATTITAASGDNLFHADDVVYGARPERRKACTPCRIEHRTCKDRDQNDICSMCRHKEFQSFQNNHPTPFVAKDMCLKATTQAYKAYKDARAFETSKGKPLAESKIAAVGKRQTQKQLREVDKIGRVKVTDRIQDTNRRRKQRGSDQGIETPQDDQMSLTPRSSATPGAKSKAGSTQPKAKKPKRSATEGSYARFFFDAEDDGSDATDGDFEY